MPYTKYSEDGLYSMTRAARECGIEPTRFWHYVRSNRLIPGPSVLRGGRFYYDGEQLENVRSVVAELRAKGRIK